MTLAHRVWLGLGLFALAILACILTVVLGYGALRSDLRSLAATEEPRAIAAVESMRASTAGTEGSSYAYLRTADPQERARFAQHGQAFEEARRRYEAFAPGFEGELLARVDERYAELAATGEDLMDGEDTRRSVLDGAEEDLQDARSSLEEIRTTGDEVGEAKSGALADVEGGIDGVRAWLGAYAVDPKPEYEDRLTNAADDLRAALDRYEDLDLTGGEREEASGLSNKLDEALPQVDRLTSLTETSGEDVTRMQRLRTETEGALDELRLVSQEGPVARDDLALDARRYAIVLLGLLVLAGILGAGAIAAASWRVLRAVRRLTAGAIRIGDGYYAERIPPGGNDELGELASALNRLARQLGGEQARPEDLGQRTPQDRAATDETAGLEAGGQEGAVEEGTRSAGTPPLASGPGTTGEAAHADAEGPPQEADEPEARRDGGRLASETEGRDALVARVLNYGIFEWNLQTDEVRWDDTLLELLDLSRGDLAPTFEALLLRVHPEDRQRVGEAIAAHLEDGAGFDPEYRIRNGGGVYRTIVSRAETERDRNGRALRMVGIVTDVTERRALEDQLASLAFFDPLTALPNRALFVDRLENALNRSRRQGAELAVMFLDLDNFKVINDSLGHESGDRSLVAVAKRLQTCLRPGDTVARFGGDEFTVLLEEVGAAQARRVAERILRELRRPVTVDGRKFYLTPSIGIAFSDATSQPTDLLRNADSAMYEAKRAGKARYEVFHSGISAEILERLELENDLRLALERREFVVYYQPKVDLDTLKVFGFEALVRWNHPQRGLIQPNDFISVAEETNLILPIGDWVLRQACQQVRRWQETFASQRQLGVSVNLSPRQFRMQDLSGGVAKTLVETGLDPDCLTLEITENVFVQDSKAALLNLRRLRDLRVGVAIDDFGKAYSSLARLKEWPIDSLKVDRSFVAGLEDGTGDKVLVSSVINMASGLGVSVVAEGVETSGQLNHLRRLGCEKAQGYYFSRPLPSAAAASLLERQARP